MATDPIFATTPNLGTPAILGDVETSLTVPTLASVIFTAGANGSLLYELDANAVTTAINPVTVAGLIYIFLYDGATYHLWDTMVVPAATGSATVPPAHCTPKQYPEGLLIKTGWSVRCSQSITTNKNLLKVTAQGADF